MELKETSNKILQKFLRLLKWILFALFLLLAIGSSDSLGNSILFLLCSLLVCPPIWDKIKNKFNPKKGLCGVIITIMFLGSLFSMPTTSTEDTDTSTNTRSNINNTTELSSALNITATITPIDTPTLTSTVAPTSTPTPTPTVAPTNTPTPTPTIAPTNTSTPTPTIAPTNTPTPTVAPTNTPTPTPTVKATQKEYVLNTSTYKIHYSSCHSAKRIKDSNRSTWTGSSVDEFLKSHPNYTRCKNCNPN